jgi:sugar O-acyltransferase (sialic acid O-acetyltransferase NeuD family)
VVALKPLVLLGGGGHGSDVLGLVEAINDVEPTWEVVGVHDDDPAAGARRFAGRALLAGAIDAAFAGPAAFVASVGYPGARRPGFTRAEAAGVRAATLVHPRAIVGAGVVIADGATVFGAAQVSPLAVIGRHACVHNGAIVGHDVVIGENCSVMPGATLSGDCVLGHDVLVGTGATVLQGVTIGGGAVVGAGAVVLEDVPDGVTVVGVPARTAGR